MQSAVLRNSVEIEDPLTVVLGHLEAGWVDLGDRSAPSSFDESDLRHANRGGARISAVEIAAILERRRAIERALRLIAPDTSLAGAARSIPWPELRQLFDAFGGIRGIGVSKATKALYRKRPSLIPILDSVVQAYLSDDDPGAQVPFAERALGLTRGFKRDLDRNRAALEALRRELSRRGYEISAARILDLLIWSAHAAA